MPRNHRAEVRDAASCSMSRLSRPLSLFLFLSPPPLPPSFSFPPSLPLLLPSHVHYIFIFFLSRRRCSPIAPVVGGKVVRARREREGLFLFLFPRGVDFGDDAYFKGRRGNKPPHLCRQAPGGVKRSNLPLRAITQPMDARTRPKLIYPIKYSEISANHFSLSHRLSLSLRD